MATVKAFDGKKVSYKSQANNGGVPVTFDGKRVSFAKPQYQYQQDFIGHVRIEDTPMGAIMAQNKAYEQARYNAIYGNTDVSNYQYQTVEEYDAEIAKLEKAYASQPKQNHANADMAPSVAMMFSAVDTPQGKKIKSQIDALKAQRNLLERALFIGNKYGNISSAADFDAKSGVMRHDEDMTYVAVNRDAYSQFPEEYNDIGWVDGGYVTTENMAKLAQKYGWSSKEATQRLLSADMLRQENEQREAEIQVARKSNEFAMLTDDERKVYNYLYNTSGANKAKEYLDDMKVVLEKRFTTAEKLDNIDRYDRASDFGKAVMNIATIPANLVGAVVAAINDVSEGISGNYSPYGTAHSLQNYADTIRGETAADINEAVKNAGGGDTIAQLAGTLYQATMSGADAMLGGAALGSGYLAIAGANAATHKAKELYESGAEGWQIAVGSVASGALEAAIEKLPLDNLLAMKNAGGADNLSAILKNILKQSGLEGTEEAITELANLATDCILQGGNSDLSRQIAVYESEGHSSAEARKMALRDKASDVLWATIAGMGSGGGSAAVFSTIGYGNMLRDTTKLGRAFLDQEGGLEVALGIGLDNARTTQAYKSAQAMAQQAVAGKSVSAYQVGKMLRDSQTTDAQKARALDHTVRQSASQYDVSADVTDMVADIAAGTGRQIVFGDLSEFDGEIDQVGGQYDPETGIVTISPKATTEQVVNFLTKHEITHSIEGTQQWDQLADIVQAQLGDEKWSDAISEVMERYAANGKELDLPHAEYEVVADWIGKNLYKSGFAQAIVNGDATVGNAFVQAIDKMRLAMGNKKSRSHTNLAVVERLFMRALENEVQTREGDGEYAFIGKLKDGTRVYESENKTISVDDAKEEFKNRIATIFNLGAVELKTDTKKLLVRGDKFTVNKNVYGDTRATETDMEAKYRMLYDMADILSTATYIPRKTQPEPSYINPSETPKNAAHKDVKYWYKFQNDIVLNEVGYTVTFNIRDKGKEQYQYLIEVKENGYTVSHTAIEGLRRTYRASTDTRVSQKVPGVKNYSMQNGKKNSSNKQSSFLPPEMMEQESGRKGKPDIYQEEGEREAYLAADRRDTSSVTADAVPPSPQGEGYDGAIDENGELDEERLKQMTEERRVTKREAAKREEIGQLREKLQRGEITDEEFDAAMARRETDDYRQGRKDGTADYRKGKRGSAEQKAAAKKLIHDVKEDLEETYRMKEARLEAEHAERRDRDRQRRESKEWTRLKNKLRDAVAAMEHILLHPNEKNAIPTEMIEPFLDITTALEGLFDDKAERIDELQQRLREEESPAKRVALQKRIQNLRDHVDNTAAVMARLNTLYGDYMEGNHVSEAYLPIAKKVDDALRMVGTRTIDGLSANEIEQLVSTIQMMMHTAAHANTLYGESYIQSVQETGEQLEREARENNILAKGWGKKLLTMQLDVKRFCAAMGGFAKNAAWNIVGQEALDGQTRMLEINRAFHDHFAKIIDDEKNPLKKLMSTKKDDLVDVGLVDVDGKPILMTRDMMLSVHQQLTCPANRQAIMDGGMVIPDMKRYYGGDEVNAYKNGKRLTRSAYCKEIGETLEAIDRCKDDEAEYYRLVDRLTDLEARASAEYDRVVEKIESLMTDTERDYCFKVREWFDTISKKHINDVTMDVFGFRKAIVKQYYPIYRDTNFVATDFESLVQNATLENTGSLKERVRSKAPVNIAGITNVLMHSEQTTARYCGFLKFTMDVNRLMNVHTKNMEHSVKDTLDHMANTSRIGLGVTPLEYIENLMADIANARKGENSLFSALRRNVIRSTMTFNPRVAVKQIGAVFTSAGELGWKYQSKAVQRIGRKLDPAMVAKYSVYFHERMYGSGGMEEFAAMKQGSNVFDRTYRKADELTKGKLFNWCQDMDNAVCKLLWHGCEAKIRETRPELKPGSEEFYQAVGKELDRVIQKTQTNYTLMERSDLSRDTRWTMKILSTYKTDAIQGFNMLFEANARYRRYKKDLAAGKGGVTQADVDATKQQLADTIPAVLVGNVLWGAFAGILMNMLMQRTSGVRDDNDEITAASVGEALLSETLGGMAGLVVFGDQVYDIAASRIFGDNYYGISDMGIETLSGLLEDFATGNFTKGKTIKYLLQDMGKVVGIPLKNAWDMGEGIAKHIEDLSNGEFLSFKADVDATTTQYYRRLYNAIQKGNTEKADEIREFLITCGETEAEIKSGLRAAAKAAVKKDDKAFEKEYQAAMQEAMEDMFYRSMREKEQKKVKSGIKSYIADQIVADKIGIEPTKANQKAEGYIEKGASIAQYFVANTAKNAKFADKNQDDEVSKAEFRSVMSDAEYDEYLKRLLMGLK